MTRDPLSALARSTGLVGLFVLQGCVGSLCRGPGCEDAYPAAQVLLFAPPFAATQTARATEALTRVTGTVDQGSEWTVDVHGAAVFVGQPEARRVSRWRPEVDGSTIGSLATWTAPWRDFGARVAAVDIRGLPDLWVSAPGEDLDAGLVAVWRTARDGSTSQEVSFVLRGESPADRFGDRMVDCPDLSGDGVRDVLIAAPRMTAPAVGDIPAQSRAGAVFLLRSERTSPVLEDSPTCQYEGDCSYAEWSQDATAWFGTDAGAAVGTALACDADLTGDGVVDVVIGGPGAGEGREGAVWVLSGADLPETGALPTPTATVTAATAWFGSAAAVGDLDGDGIGDLAVGAAGAADGTGEVHVFYGPELDLARTVIEPPESTEPTHLGRALLLADLDGDGLDELVVGAEDWVDGEEFDAGRVGIWRGSTIRLGPHLQMGADEDWQILPDHAFQRLGGELAAHDLGLLLPVRRRDF